MALIEFENKPSTNTPINATNLNLLQDNVENGINDVQTNLENKINGIIESGSNENGSYIKYADGTQICRKTIFGTVDITTSVMGSFYYGSVNLGNFASSFLERPTIVVSPQTQSGTQYFLSGSPGATHGDEFLFGEVTLLRPTSRANLAYILDAIAIGRWK